MKKGRRKKRRVKSVDENGHLKKQQRKHKILSFYEAMKWHEISSFLRLACSVLPMFMLDFPLRCLLAGKVL